MELIWVDVVAEQALVYYINQSSTWPSSRVIPGIFQGIEVRYDSCRGTKWETE